MSYVYYYTLVSTGVGAGDSGSDSEMYKLISLENLEDRASPELWPEQSKYDLPLLRVFPILFMSCVQTWSIVHRW